MNKPIYIGFSVLDLSKSQVYEFHYDIMPRLAAPENIKLLYTDTDSLVYDIKDTNIYAAMRDNIQYFKTSDYPENNCFQLPRVNKKIVGLMKDECNGEIMTEFVGFRAKMYSARVNGEDRMKKCKGVKTSVVKKTINFEDYFDCLNLHKIQTESSALSALKDTLSTRWKWTRWP